MIVIDFQTDDYSESSREELSSLGKAKQRKTAGKPSHLMAFVGKEIWWVCLENIHFLRQESLGSAHSDTFIHLCGISITDYRYPLTGPTTKDIRNNTAASILTLNRDIPL